MIRIITGRDEGDDFCTAILQQIHGQAAAYNGTAALTEFGQFGENMCYRFDLDCEDFDIIQWYVVGDYEYVMFGLMIVDEDKADEDDCIQMTWKMRLIHSFGTDKRMENNEIRRIHLLFL